MAKKTINALTVTDTITDDDFVSIWRASDGDTRKITKSNFLDGLDTELVTARTAGNNDGATPVSLSDAISYAAGGIYNVLAYGATGDGSTDDTTAIQNALDAAETAGGGVVFFPRGTYKITAELTGASYVTLRGAGWKSIIDWRSTTNANAVNFSDSTDAGIENLQIQNLSTVCAGSAILTGSSSARIRIRNVKIVGTTITKTISSISGDSTTLTVNTTAAHELASSDNVYIYGTGGTYDAQYSGIVVADSDTFTDLSSTNNGTVNAGTVQKMMWLNGVRIQGTDSLVEGCDISNGLNTAMRAYGTALRNKFTNNYISDVMRGFMGDFEGGDGASHNLISGNTFHLCAHAAAKIEDTAEHNIFSNNNISECSKSVYGGGTIAIGGAYTTIENNNFYFDTPLSEAAIDIETDAVHAIVKGNTIVGHTGYGVHLHSGVSVCSILDNHIDGADTGIRSTNSTCSYVMCCDNRITNSATYGIRLARMTGFLIQNNMIVTVTTSHGIFIELTCYYGSVVGNMIINCGGAGIAVSNSATPSKYISVTGNVIYDVGNTTATSAHITMSSSHTAIAVVGNVMDDTAHDDSIETGTVTNVPVVGNSTSDGVDLGTGTTSSANY